MSEVTQEVNVQEQRQAKLEHLHWIVRFYACLMAGGALLASLSVAFLHGSETIMMLGLLAGLVLFGGPALIKFLQCQTLLGLFKFEPDYEVITTYKDGTKKSDHGLQSFQTNIAITAIVGFAVLSTSYFIAPLMFIFVSIKYAIAYMMANPKPAFVKSAFIFMVAAVVIVIGAPSLAFTKLAAQVGGSIKEGRAVYENPEGQPAIIQGEALKLRAEPVATGAVVKELQPQDTITVIGTRSGAYMEVEFNGQRGWAYSHFLRTVGRTDIMLGLKYPYEARVTKRINAKRNAYGDDSPLTLEEGTVIQVLSTSTAVGHEGPGLYFKYNDLDYRMHGMNNIEFVVPVE